MSKPISATFPYRVVMVLQIFSFTHLLNLSLRFCDINNTVFYGENQRLIRYMIDTEGLDKRFFSEFGKEDISWE